MQVAINATSLVHTASGLLVFWQTEMVCGVYLGILLICFVDHVCCLWAAEAWSSQNQNRNRYVGISQQHGGPGRPGGTYSQNQLRQAYVSPGSGQSSSLNTETDINKGYSRGLFSSGYPHLSQSAQGGYPSTGLVQSRAGSKPNWRMPNEVTMRKVPAWQLHGLSASVASGGFVSQYNQNGLDIKKRTWPIQHGTPRASRLSSSSASERPSENYSFTMASQQSAAQKAPSASAKSSVYYGGTGSSSLFSARAPAPQTQSVQLPTSGSASAKRVSSRPVLSKPSCLFPHFERTRNSQSPTQAAKPYQNRLFAVNREPAQGSTGSLQASWNSGNSAQGARKLPTFQRIVPTRTISIPQCLGGHAIRRLKKPDQEEEVVKKPQQTYTTPPLRPAPLKPRAPSKLLRIRPSWTLAGAQGPWLTR